MYADPTGYREDPHRAPAVCIFAVSASHTAPPLSCTRTQLRVTAALQRAALPRSTLRLIAVPEPVVCLLLLGLVDRGGLEGEDEKGENAEENDVPARREKYLRKSNYQNIK